MFGKAAPQVRTPTLLGLRVDICRKGRAICAESADARHAGRPRRALQPSRGERGTSRLVRSSLRGSRRLFGAGHDRSHRRACTWQRLPRHQERKRNFSVSTLRMMTRIREPPISGHGADPDCSPVRCHRRSGRVVLEAAQRGVGERHRPSPQVSASSHLIATSPGQSRFHRSLRLRGMMWWSRFSPATKLQCLRMPSSHRSIQLSPRYRYTFESSMPPTV